MRAVDGDALRAALPMAEAIDALERAFQAGPAGGSPPRSRVPTPDGDLMLMPATGEPGSGVKLVTIAPANPSRGLPLIHAVYVLFARETMEPALLVDGAALTALRTGAVSGVATRWLARPDPSDLVLFGAGVQARAHLEAMVAVRPSIERALVVSRGRSRAEALAEEARRLGLDAAVGEPGDVARADVVCCCTTSEGPLFDGDLLPPGVHVNAVGSYRPDARELDDRTIARGLVVVETREAALAEAGDLLIPIGAGLIGPDHVAADLFEVVAGKPVRTQPQDVTVFKSVGVGFEDLAVAGALLEGMTR